ncbi:MAG: hypothetical protein NTY51_15255 [Deltaproteobacteria bacterium]|nr:hypothetical protein [Deltaproteobacteria bacterium]
MKRNRAGFRLKKRLAALKRRRKVTETIQSISAFSVTGNSPDPDVTDVCPDQPRSSQS